MPSRGILWIRDVANDFGSESHTVDFLSSNALDNGLNLKFTGRYHRASTGVYLAFMTGISDAASDAEVRFRNADGSPEQPKTSVSSVARTPSRLPQSEGSDLMRDQNHLAP